MQAFIFMPESCNSSVSKPSCSSSWKTSRTNITVLPSLRALPLNASTFIGLLVLLDPGFNLDLAVLALGHLQRRLHSSIAYVQFHPLVGLRNLNNRIFRRQSFATG